MNLSECYTAYLAAVCPDHATGSHRTLKGSARDAALLPLSCVPVLAMDNHGYSYPVYVGPSEYQDGRPELTLIGAPSGWFLDSMIDDRDNFAGGCAIDSGQGWICTNIQEVIDAVVASGVYLG